MSLADRGQTLLGGIVGSRAYGLNQPDSDTDRMRVVALPTTDMLGLSNPKLTEHTAIPGGDDITTYEIRDFIGQALKSAPGALDMLWLPSHTTMSPHGEELVANRSRFLSQSSATPRKGYCASTHGPTLPTRRSPPPKTIGTHTGWSAKR